VYLSHRISVEKHDGPRISPKAATHLQKASILLFALRKSRNHTICFKEKQESYYLLYKSNIVLLDAFVKADAPCRSTSAI